MYDFRLVRSTSNDPSINLALEEYLIEQKEPVLYLWQNEPTVVIGRNQNPYKECNLKKMNENGVHLMRRRSGGGAVFHDFGNINFTIISPKYPAIVEDNFNLVIKVLKEFNIEATISGRNDLEVEGRKISGSAFFEEDNIYCHHGTLLVDVDMKNMEQYLTPSKLKLESKGIDSVKSRVINLKELNPNISIDKIEEAFSKELNKKFEIVSENKLLNNLEIKNKIDKYRSWNWTYGETSNFNVTFKDKFSWGIFEINLLVDSGKILKCKIYTDSINTKDFDKLEISLCNKLFSKEMLISCTKKIISDQKISEDLCKLYNF